MIAQLTNSKTFKLIAHLSKFGLSTTPPPPPAPMGRRNGYANVTMSGKGITTGGGGGMLSGQRGKATLAVTP